MIVNDKATAIKEHDEKANLLVKSPLSVYDFEHESVDVVSRLDENLKKVHDLSSRILFLLSEVKELIKK